MKPTAPCVPFSLLPRQPHDCAGPAIARQRTTPAPAPAVLAGTVWVVARHALVAQALAAALGRRVQSVRMMGWDVPDASAVDVDAERDLVLIIDDLDSPDAIASVLSRVRRAPARTVVMTELAEGHAWGALLAAGATEVVSELGSVEQLVGFLEKVGAGEAFLSDERRAALSASWERHLVEDQALLDRMATLSPRERAVLLTLAAGSRPADISEQLGVTPSTVRTHLRSIRNKLGVDSQLRAALVVHRLESRIPLPEPDMPAPRRPHE